MAQPSVEYPWTKVHELEFQELIYERARLVQSAACFQCMNFDLLLDYHVCLKVLRDLGYIDDTGKVQLTGCVACEMNSTDKLTLTELILDNTLAQYEPEEIVALISAFMGPEMSENTDLTSRVPAQLKNGRQQVVETAKRIES
ncbi:Antiviral helicase ski2 [Linderina macrospora]|uniref:Antiviral helicase ski2 n=1 Tax=Linderina macrospora TaxID=4868 RepID=A0ACC1JHZ6_9FUNG|nr:Antiviral helicase ski2 [Linderina macrospora]